MEAMRKGLGGEWDVLRDYNPGRGLVYVRGEVGISFGPHAGIVSTGYGWLDDGEGRRAEVDAIRAVARFFHSPGIIFSPDDIEPYIFASTWIADGSTFGDLQRRLAAIKAPAPDFRAAILHMADRFEVDGYVLERLQCEAV
jgi:hypothetical protein